MTTKNDIIIITKKSLENFSIVSNKKFEIGYYLQTDPSKEICEDAILLKSENQNLMLAVCDGVGGSDRSYRAAKHTLEHLSSLPLNISSEELTKELEKINKKLLELEGCPQTTLTLAIINQNQEDYRCIQIGDSSLIHCSNHGNLKYKANIQSTVGEMLKEGKITEEEALKHPELHIVNNVLGHNNFYAEITSGEKIQQNDTILMTSDGLLDNFTSNELIEIICKNSISDGCTKLFNAAHTHKNILKDSEFNKIDDISFICVKKL